MALAGVDGDGTDDDGWRQVDDRHGRPASRHGYRGPVCRGQVMDGGAERAGYGDRAPFIDTSRWLETSVPGTIDAVAYRPPRLA